MTASGWVVVTGFFAVGAALGALAMVCALTVARRNRP